MQPVKVSIITINKNNKDGLEGTIKSVTRQTLKDFEFIVIDGDSKDGSTNIITKYQSCLNRWISEPDEGIYHAMNKGISLANGEYLLFLNSGDQLHDETVISAFYSGQYTEDIIYGDIIYEGESSAFVMPDKITLSTFTGASIGHGAAFIKSELIKKLGRFNQGNKIVSDWEFFLKAFIRFECSYKHIERILTIYQKGGVSISPKYYELQAEERARVFKTIFPLYNDIIEENAALKHKLAGYEQSRVIRFIKKLQGSRLNQLRNKFARFQ